MVRVLFEKAWVVDIFIYIGLGVEVVYDVGIKVEVEIILGWFVSVWQVLVCINGFVWQLLFDLKVWLVCNQVLIIEFVKVLKIWGVFYYDWGYFYFCNIDNWILFGGGCNFDIEVEVIFEFGIILFIWFVLVCLLWEVIFFGQDVGVVYWWSGILGVGCCK